MPGIPELLVILLIVLLIFGAGKLPAIGDAMGKTIRNFKKAAGGSDDGAAPAKKKLAKTQRAELGARSDEDVEEAEVVIERKGEELAERSPAHKDA